MLRRFGAFALIVRKSVQAPRVQHRSTVFHAHPAWARLARRTVLFLLAALLALAAPKARGEVLHFDAVQGAVAIDLLADAASHGLDPQAYGLAALRQVFAQSRAQAPNAAAVLDTTLDTALDTALSAAMTRYLQDLHFGRSPPRPARPARFDAVAALRAALALQDLPLAVRQAAPEIAQYERLRDVLAQYRQWISHPAWRSAAPVLSQPLSPGQSWSGVPQLRARLQVLGDWREAAPIDDPFDLVFDSTLVNAVQRFQQRHGLLADGVIGRGTWAALQVTPRQRVRQLELALERLRWLPLLDAPRQIVINIPEFVLRAYEVQGTRIAVQQTMKVIVGKALDTRTPLIHAPMHRIEFNPYWNVPTSIAQKELVPKLRREPALWEQQGFEFVSPRGVVNPSLNAKQLDAVMAGQLRIRQRPGPRNALGRIKFVFPNHASIYLHHTPSVQLFERTRRDFSHGCIRVQAPVALAQFVLAGQAGWSEARIVETMASDQPSTVILAHPLPVLITYVTALVKDAQVYFFADLYGHDQALDLALRRLPVRTLGASLATRDKGLRLTARVGAT
jgi:L,D-transpeptidase YcbB